MRECGDLAGGAGDRHGGGADQDHEGGEGAQNCLRAVPRHVHPRHDVHHPHDPRGPPQGHSR